MNLLRSAYMDLDPEAARYVLSSAEPSPAGVLEVMGLLQLSPTGSFAHAHPAADPRRRRDGGLNRGIGGVGSEPALARRDRGLNSVEISRNSPNAGTAVRSPVPPWRAA
jgi:hypothetical protein